MQRPIETPVGSPASGIDTPALLVDIERLDANTETLSQPVRAGAWVHRTPAIAHRQLRHRHVTGIAVRGVAEAEVFAAAGCADIRILRPLVTASAQRRAEALSRAVHLVTEDDGVPVWDEDALAGAVTVSARVAGTPEPDRAIHDCGQKAIGRDGGNPRVKGHPDLVASAGSAEHGIVAVREGRQPFSIGDWLELEPGDIATAFTLHDYAHGIAGGRLEAVWRVSGRGAFQ